MVLSRQFAIRGFDFFECGIGANVQNGIVIGPRFGSDHRSARAIPGGGKSEGFWVVEFGQKVGSECGNRESRRR